jgi:peptidoglycan/LPS O-acetylase OafA/YrhL
VAATAIIFGGAHGVWGLFGRQWRVAAGAAAATGVLGALLGIVYVVSGRDVAPCIWSHMLINLAIEILADCRGGVSGRPRLAPGPRVNSAGGV